MGFLAYVVGACGAKGRCARRPPVHVDRLGGVPPLLPRPVPAGHLRLDLEPSAADVPGSDPGHVPLSGAGRVARWTSSPSFPPPSRRGSSARGRSRPSSSSQLYLERIERLDPELGAYVTVRGDEALAEARAKADEPADAPFHGVPISLKDLDTTAGTRTTFSSLAFASNVPDFDLAHVTRLKTAGVHRAREDEHARVRHDRLHRLEAERPVPHAVGSRAKRGRLERRRGGGARSRAVRDRAGLRRRRLDQDPRLLLRRARLQGLTRPDLGGAVRARDRPRNDRAARPHDRRRRRVPRRRLRLRVGRPVPGAAARAAVRGRGRRRAWPAPGRGDDRARRSTRRSTPPASRPRATPPSCSAHSATRSRRRRRTGAGRA